jgi:hypothetical protein
MSVSIFLKKKTRYFKIGGMICTGIFKKEKDLYPLTPATERHGLWPWMITLTFGRDVAPLGD